MNASIQGALKQLNKSYSTFEHRGKRMSKSDVKKVLEYGLKKGYESTNQFSDEEVDKLLSPDFIEPKWVKFSERKPVKIWDDIKVKFFNGWEGDVGWINGFFRCGSEGTILNKEIEFWAE